MEIGGLGFWGKDMNEREEEDERFGPWKMRRVGNLEGME